MLVKLLILAVKFLPPPPQKGKTFYIFPLAQFNSDSSIQQALIWKAAVRETFP
jgi:hypothetical protein